MNDDEMRTVTIVKNFFLVGKHRGFVTRHSNIKTGPQRSIESKEVVIVVYVNVAGRESEREREQCYRKEDALLETSGKFLIYAKNETCKHHNNIAHTPRTGLE